MSFRQPRLIALPIAAMGAWSLACMRYDYVVFEGAMLGPGWAPEGTGSDGLTWDGTGVVPEQIFDELEAMGPNPDVTDAWTVLFSHAADLVEPSPTGTLYAVEADTIETFQWSPMDPDSSSSGTFDLKQDWPHYLARERRADELDHIELEFTDTRLDDMGTVSAQVFTDQLVDAAASEAPTAVFVGDQTDYQLLFIHIARLEVWSK